MVEWPLCGRYHTTLKENTMIYFVVAQQEQDGEWKLFGPWECVEMADERIAELNTDPGYAQVELARVLTDEDGPDWEHSVSDL